MRVHNHQKSPSDKAWQIGEVVHCIEAQTKFAGLRGVTRLAGLRGVTRLGGCSDVPDGLEI